ncbi:TetR/AcrR family transcriptional regulator [Paenibacillus sp. OV219]|uniref:TetR/AcrR family transcriptional regulator n=1 Tax=Paenibacillus sp. OV219 TaxID=1884377 RepID=UPI0008C95F65|nr:TetR/AcrR family transcriptional regulator [Paenibacillus sp. OV219]SEM64199.1 transcriptional regulator, TetR family [Paenibacillus sp. OV219]
METTGGEAPICRYTDESILNKYAAKLLHPIKTNGLHNLRMDDIAKAMDLSKATLYKYFPSRDEIIERLTALIVKYVIGGGADVDLIEGSCDGYIEGFQSTFSQTLLIANYGTEIFFRDLREIYPQLMASIDVAISERNARLRKFYERGMAEGYLNSLNATLLILEDELMFRHLLDPMYLMKNNLTLRNAIGDYYQIKKLQWFKPNIYASFDDTLMMDKIEHLVRKVTYGVA